MNAITVVSLGPGSREYLTLGALDALKKAKKIRTLFCLFQRPQPHSIRQW